MRWTNLSDLEFVENVLKNLIVLNHLVLALRVEVHLMHRHHPRMSGVHQLTVNRTRTRLSPHTHTHQKNFKKKIFPPQFRKKLIKLGLKDEREREPLRLWRGWDGEWSWSKPRSPIFQRSKPRPSYRCSSPSPIDFPMILSSFETFLFFLFFFLCFF